MREDIQDLDSKFNTKMSCSDWRYSASVVGLILYFEHNEIEHVKQDDYILYNYEDITLERYLNFVEVFFEDYMHHKKLEKLLINDILTEEEDKEFKKLLKGNAVMTNVFSQFNNFNKLMLENTISENREKLIEGTYKTGQSLYAKFSDSNSFFSEKRHCCRLVGFYFDGKRKSKNLGYGFEKNSFVYEDCLEFDFIPFAFSKTNESLFINNNFSVKQLIETYRNLNHNNNPRQAIFDSVNKSSTFIDYDVEVIVKSYETQFETLYIRKEAIEIFKSINQYEYFANKYVKINKVDYLNLEKEITNCILNLNKLDTIILTLLKISYQKSVINLLITINIKLYGGGEMEKQTFMAKKTAQEIVSKIDDNKVKSFKNKLLSALAIEDYDSFNIILLKLSNYAGVDLAFAYDLFDDFESNKNVAFSFVNALSVKKDNNEENN